MSPHSHTSPPDERAGHFHNTLQTLPPRGCRVNSRSAFVTAIYLSMYHARTHRDARTHPSYRASGGSASLPARIARREPCLATASPPAHHQLTTTTTTTSPPPHHHHHHDFTTVFAKHGSVPARAMYSFSGWQSSGIASSCSNVVGAGVGVGVGAGLG